MVAKQGWFCKYHFLMQLNYPLKKGVYAYIYKRKRKPKPIYLFYYYIFSLEFVQEPNIKVFLLLLNLIHFYFAKSLTLLNLLILFIPIYLKIYSGFLYLNGLF